MCSQDYEAALLIYNDLITREKTAKLELKAAIGRIHLQVNLLTLMIITKKSSPFDP